MTWSQLVALASRLASRSERFHLRRNHVQQTASSRNNFRARRCANARNPSRVLSGRNTTPAGARCRFSPLHRGSSQFSGKNSFAAGIKTRTSLVFLRNLAAQPTKVRSLVQPRPLVCRRQAVERFEIHVLSQFGVFGVLPRLSDCQRSADTAPTRSSPLCPGRSIRAPRRPAHPVDRQLSAR